MDAVPIYRIMQFPNPQPKSLSCTAHDLARRLRNDEIVLGLFGDFLCLVRFVYLQWCDAGANQLGRKVSQGNSTICS